MSLDARRFTGFPDVDAILLALLSEVRAILGDAFFGMYLYGSLATGDFNPGSSDIDFVVVTKDILPDATIQALQAMHRKLAASGDAWAKKLEGSYIPLSQLRRRDARHRFPSINEGHFFLQSDGNDWIIQRQTLREQPVIVAGPPPCDWIDPVLPDDIRRAVLGILETWWKPLADDHARLQRDDYQAFAVLSMCRALYALEYGVVVSKPVAARWARATLGDEWNALIARAMQWQQGTRMDALEPVRAFIRYTLGRSRTIGTLPDHAG